MSQFKTVSVCKTCFNKYDGLWSTCLGLSKGTCFQCGEVTEGKDMMAPYKNYWLNLVDKKENV